MMLDNIGQPDVDTRDTENSSRSMMDGSKGKDNGTEFIDSLEQELSLGLSVSTFPRGQGTHQLKPHRAFDETPTRALPVRENQQAVDGLIKRARTMKASDIHIEPGIDTGRIRFRIDGQLSLVHSIGMEEYPCLVNRIKVMAQLDIAEKRVPQDGRIEWPELDLRVSIIPVMYGEKIVLRLLQRDIHALDLNTLGMSPEQLQRYTKAISKPQGLLLISGPTGSGKTTTLYSTLKLLNREGVNILTVEDPIEYSIPGIAQVQVKQSVGLSFAAALRSFLRQDPDIIMVGEIRDPETVSIAVRAALTGHLVLSTIHTNSAISAITRMKDLGIAPYLIEDTLIGSIAQRLLRSLCIHCRQPCSSTDPRYSGTFNPGTLFEERGCDRCHRSGFSGRTGVFEMVTARDITPGLVQGNSDFTLHDGSLADHGLELVLNGVTSPNEFRRVFGVDFRNSIKKRQEHVSGAT